MADRVQYYFRQRVTEDELNLGFEGLEVAQRNMTSDLGWKGVMYGCAVTQNSPAANLSVLVGGPGACYDLYGQRIYIPANQTIDCSVDYTGASTTVTLGGYQKYLSIYARFKRTLSDARIDGNSQQIYFKRTDSFEIIVRQGSQATAGAAARPALQAGEILLGDVLLSYGTTQIFNAQILTDRTQKLYVAAGKDVSVDSSAFTTFTQISVQAMLASIDSSLTGHYAGNTNRHAATNITFATTGAFGTVFGATTTDAQSALDLVASTLNSTTTGAGKIGAPGVAGTPNALSAATLASQVASILGFINNHQNNASGAHAGSAISAPTVSQSPVSLATTTVAGQLSELLTAENAHRNNATGAHAGSAISAPTVSQTPNSLTTTTVTAQLTELLTAINALAAPRSAQIITAVGSGTWTKPAGCTFVEVMVVGGGGGGGGGAAFYASSTSQAACGGGGGGSGSIAHARYLASDLPATVSYTVGDGGAGGSGFANTTTCSGSTGSNGADTTFHNLVAAGGRWGTAGYAATTLALTSAGSGGDGYSGGGSGGLVWYSGTQSSTTSSGGGTGGTGRVGGNGGVGQFYTGASNELSVYGGTRGSAIVGYNQGDTGLSDYNNGGTGFGGGGAGGRGATSSYNASGGGGGNGPYKPGTSVPVNAAASSANASGSYAATAGTKGASGCIVILAW